MEDDVSLLGEYIRGGIVTQHKEPKTLSFKTLTQALEDPGEFLLSDFSKMERPAMLHVGFQALDAFQVCVFVWLVCVFVCIVGRYCVHKCVYVLYALDYTYSIHI